MSTSPSQQSVDNHNKPSNQNFNQSPTSPIPSKRGSSFLASLLPITSSSFTHQPSPRHNSMSSSTGSSFNSDSISSNSTDRANLTGSPTSSLASPGASKSSPNQLSNSVFSPVSPGRQASLSGSFSNLTSSFRWPTSASPSSVQPIAIPNSHSGVLATEHDTPSSLTGCSAPTRRSSIGNHSFRRAFELPNYSNLYTLNDHSQDSSAQSDAARRGRSGSLFSSFGVGDASKRTSGPPRRKLSPMGERMIRDHPF